MSEAGCPREAADERARLLARTVFDRPLVLEAGAGTGKTTVLVTRAVAWCLGPGWERARAELGEAAHVDAIGARVARGVVAITFTEAAAAEMGTRLSDALREIEVGKPPEWLPVDALPADAAARAPRARALRGALDHLRVQTIHAFCRRLLVAYPLEAGVHPRLEIDAEGALREAVVRDVLEEALPRAFADEGSPALRLAAAGVGPALLERALVDLLELGLRSDDLAADPFAKPRLAGLHARAAAALDACLAAAAGLDAVGGASSLAPRVIAALALARAELPAEPWTDAAALAEFAGRWRAAWSDDERNAVRLRKWAAADLTKAEAAAVRDAQALAAAAAALVPLADHLGRLDPPLLDEARRALVPLLAEVEARLRARGIASFGELLRGARELLRAHPEVAAQERARIDQLLVDEFQDTDRLQCDALRALALEGAPAERPGLFLVGDPKQSIYGWRSADLAAYEGFVADVLEAGGERAPLSRNYRSTPAILAEVERLVAPVMRREPLVQPAFEPLLAAAPASPVPLPEALAAVEYWIPAEWDAAAGAAKQLNAAERSSIEARTLAAELRALHDAGAIAWKDAGVLFRSRGDLEVYLEALRDAGVPYAVEGDRSYFQRREIVEAAALVRAIAEPNDHVALLAALRSSQAGVPDAALLALWRAELPARAARLVDPCPEELARLRALLAEVAAAPPEGVPGLARIAGWHEAAAALLAAIARLRRSLRDDPADVFVERLRRLTLLEAVEGARHLGPWRAANLDRFFRELADALAADGGVQGCLRALHRAIVAEQRREESRPREAAEDAVQVMTIHGAKGLDFRCVYAMQLHKGPGGDDREAVEAGSPRHGGALELRLFGAPTPGFDCLEAERRRVAEAERVRGLYVATTRAKQRLVLSGVWPAPGAKDGRSLADLVARRRDLEAHPDERLVRLASRTGEDRVDADGARWVFPGLLALPPPEAGAGARGAAGAPAPEAVAAESAALARARRVAQARARRPFAATASAAGGEEEPDALAERRFGEAAARAPFGAGEDRAFGAGEDRADAEVARAVGVVIHAALEELDLEAPPEQALARARERLPALVRGAAEPAARDEALARALELLERFAAGPLHVRLRALAAAGPLLRELPVLLPPGAEALDALAATAFTSGVVDLVYRDPESGELVIADYKTDRVDGEAALRERAGRYAAQGAVYQRALRDALSLAYTPRFELWFLAAGAGTVSSASPR